MGHPTEERSPLRIRLFYLIAVTSFHAFAQAPVAHSLALRHLLLEGDVQIVGNGSLIFSDNTVQSTAAITSIKAGAGIAMSGGTTPTLSVDSAQVQSRITGTCAGTGSVVAVNIDGNVTCSAQGRLDSIAGGTTQITAPPGVTYLVVEAWSGGGAGNVSNGTFGGFGGGAGGYARVLIEANVAPLDISVGHGGKQTIGAIGGDGTDTTVWATAGGVAAPILTVTGGKGANGLSAGIGGSVTALTQALLLQSGSGGDGSPGAFLGASGAGGATPFGAILGAGGAGGPSGGTSSPGYPGLVLISYH